MYDSAIIIVYHEKNDVTINNYERFRYFNPNVPIALIKHEDFELLPYWDYDWMWGYNDTVWYRWFLSKHKILADRYFIFDYDTYPNDSLKNFYKNVWDDQFACPDHFSIQQYHNWSWFEKFSDQLFIYKDKLYGVCPPTGMMIRHDDAENLIKVQMENSIWRNVFLELRIGTILNLNNVKISFIDKDKKHYMTPFQHVVPPDYKEKVGIYHPVKTIDKEEVIHATKNNPLTVLSAAYYSADEFKQETDGLRKSNTRYNSIDISFYGIDKPFKSLYDAKIPDLLEVIENQCDSELVCFLDSHDTLLNNNLDDNFINIFKSFNCNIVFGAETNCYPIEQFNFIDTNNSEFKYLNSGIFVGYRKYIIEVLKSCISYYDNFINLRSIGWGAPNDQTFFWITYLLDTLQQKGDIKLDYNYELFLNVIGKNVEHDFDYSKGYLTFNNKRPYVIHAPGCYKGEAYQFMKKQLLLVE